MQYTALEDEFLPDVVSCCSSWSVLKEKPNLVVYSEQHAVLSRCEPQRSRTLRNLPCTYNHVSSPQEACSGCVFVHALAKQHPE